MGHLRLSWHCSIYKDALQCRRCIRSLRLESLSLLKGMQRCHLGRNMRCCASLCLPQPNKKARHFIPLVYLKGLKVEWRCQDEQKQLQMVWYSNLLRMPHSHYWHTDLTEKGHQFVFKWDLCSHLPYWSLLKHKTLIFAVDL